MLDQTFAALADPTRRSILELLADGELSVGEVVESFSIAQSAVSRHLNVLEKARLIERRRVGQRRMCILRAEPMTEVEEWMAVHRRHWQKALKRLDKAVTDSERKS